MKCFFIDNEKIELTILIQGTRLNLRSYCLFQDQANINYIRIKYFPSNLAYDSIFKAIKS